MIIQNISLSYLETYSNFLEYNSLTNMGICIFQDFFVTRTIFLLDRGFLNGMAVYGVGLLGSFINILNFNFLSKKKFSDSNEFSVNLSDFTKNAFISIFVSSFVVLVGVLVVFSITFPDYIAVYDPFEKRIK